MNWYDKEREIENALYALNQAIEALKFISRDNFVRVDNKLSTLNQNQLRDQLRGDINLARTTLYNLNRQILKLPKELRDKIIEID